MNSKEKIKRESADNITFQYYYEEIILLTKLQKIKSLIVVGRQYKIVLHKQSIKTF